MKGDGVASMVDVCADGGRPRYILRLEVKALLRC